MKRLLQSDVTKLLLYLTLTLACAVALVPWLYNAGRMLSEVALSRSANSLVLWIAYHCETMSFQAYFWVSLVLSAAVLFFLLVASLRLKQPQHHTGPWGVRLNAADNKLGQPLGMKRSRLLHFFTGFLLLGGLYLAMMWMLLFVDWIDFKPSAFSHPNLYQNIVLAAVGVFFLVLLLESILRGAVLGILLRAFSPAWAVGFSAILFAALFLFSPLPGVQVDSPEEADAGIRHLILIKERLAQPLTWILGFVNLLLLGCILGYSRYKTASIWLGTGLLSGGLFSHVLLRSYTTGIAPSMKHMKVFVGESYISGAIPFCILISAFLLVHVFTLLDGEPTPPVIDEDH